MIEHWKIFAGVLVVITGPIGLAVGAIVLLATHFGQVKDVAASVAGWFAGPFVNFFVTGFNDVKNIATTVVNFFKTWGTTILAVVERFIGLPTLIVQHWGQIVGFFHDLWGKVTSTVSTGIDNTVSFVTGLPARIAYGLGHLAGTLVRAAIDGWAGFTSGIVTAWDTTASYLAATPARFMHNLAAIGSFLSKLASDAWDGFTSGISTAWNATAAYLAATPQRFMNNLSAIGSFLSGLAVSAWNGFTSGLSTAWNATASYLASLPGRFMQGLSNIGSSLASTATTAWNGFTGGLETGWNTTASFLTALPGCILAFFTGANRWLINTGSDILHGLIGGLESGAMSVIHWFTGLVGNFLGGFRDALGVKSPSTVFASIGNDILQGLINGIQALGGAVLTVIVGVGQSIIDGFRTSIDFLATMWTNLWTGIRDVATAIWTGIRDFLTAEMHGWANIFSAIWQGISDVFTNIWNTLHDTAVNVWNTVHDFLVTVHNDFAVFFKTIWQGILDFFTTRWNNLHDNAINIWNTISDFFTGAFRAFTDFFSGVWQGILDYFTTTWVKLQARATDGWTNIRSFFEAAFSSFKQFFIDTWNGIVTDFSNIWNGIVGIADKVWVMVQDKFKSGINEVIGVINKFAGAINTVASAIGFDLKLHVDPLAEGGPVVGRYEGGTIAYKEVIHRATGGGVSGQLPGYSPGVDTIPAMAGKQPYMLAGGEYIVRPESTRAIGPVGMAAINNAYRNPIGLAAGGATWPAMLGIIQGQFPDAIDTSDYRPGDPGYHGRNGGEALDVGFAGNNRAKLLEADRWIGSNYSNSTELIHLGGVNIKNGQNVGDGMGFYGAATMNEHDTHVHWANDRDPSLNSGNLLGTVVGNVSGAVKSLLGAAARLALTPVKAAISTIGDHTGYPGGMAAHTMNTVLDKLISFSDAKDATSGAGSASMGPLGGNADAYAREITRSAMEHGFGKPGAAIGVATGIVETGLKMYANSNVPESLSLPHDAVGSDHDSTGLFQQRQAGWGTLAERMNPHASADLFFNKLGGFDWRSMDPGAAAQRVQVSAFPDRYSGAMGQANAIVSGYDLGGIASGRGLLPKYTPEPERVLSPQHTVAFDKMVASNFEPSSAVAQAAKPTVVAGVHVAAGAHFHTTDEAETNRLARNEAARLAAAF